MSSSSASASTSAGNNLIVAENYLKNTPVVGYSQMTDTNAPLFNASAERDAVINLDLAHSPLFFPKPSHVENRVPNLRPDRNNPDTMIQSFCIDTLTFSPIPDRDRCINCLEVVGQRYSGNKCKCKVILCSPDCLRDFLDYSPVYRKCPTCPSCDFTPSLKRYSVIGTEYKITQTDINIYRKEITILQNITTFWEIAQGAHLWNLSFEDLSSPFQRLHWSLHSILYNDFVLDSDYNEEDTYRSFYLSHYGRDSPVDWNEIKEPEYCNNERYSVVVRQKQVYTLLNLRFFSFNEFVSEIIYRLDEDPFCFESNKLFCYLIEDDWRIALDDDVYNPIWTAIIQTNNTAFLRKMLKTGQALREAIGEKYLPETDTDTLCDILNEEAIFETCQYIKTEYKTHTQDCFVILESTHLLP